MTRNFFFLSLFLGHILTVPSFLASSGQLSGFQISLGAGAKNLTFCSKNVTALTPELSFDWLMPAEDWTIGLGAEAGFSFGTTRNFPLPLPGTSVDMSAPFHLHLNLIGGKKFDALFLYGKIGLASQASLAAIKGVPNANFATQLESGLSGGGGGNYYLTDTFFMGMSATWDHVKKANFYIVQAKIGFIL